MTTTTLTSTMNQAPANLARWAVWGLFALVLIAAPLLFHKGAALSLLSQIGTAMIFGLSFNMLLGQGGMLSFGHAVYSGLGAFFAIHAMNLAAGGTLPIPTSLIPLVGGVAGMGFGILFGYVTTRRSGTTFSMITLGLVELVFASSLMFPEFFGGEGGITSNRMLGQPFLGITFGPQIEVYYLIAAWLFLCTIGMYAFTQTPLGRLSNAVRDNPERVEFIGYDAQWVRYLTLIASAFFAGIAGGLSAVNYEIVSAENVSALRSGAVLLFTFIGGIGFFCGPMIGAVIGVLLTVLLSDFSRAWQLYLGVFFIVIVMYAPGGMAMILMQNVRLVKFGKFGKVFPSMCALVAAGALALAGVVAAIEMLYHLTLAAADGSTMTLFGIGLDIATATPWLVAAALFLAGGAAFLKTQGRFQQAWDDANGEIDTQKAGA